MAKVLLVEDDNNLREIYEARLQAEGYETATASDGEQALVVAKETKPDLVISDVMMPKISGFEMLDILRNTDGMKDVKVIMLTALGQAEDKARADQLGADRYLVKSQVTLEDIVKTAHQLLDESPAPPAAPAAAAAASSDDPVASAPATTADEAAVMQSQIENFAAQPAAPTPTVDPVAPAAQPVATTDDSNAATHDDQVMAEAVTSLGGAPDAQKPSDVTAVEVAPTAPAVETPAVAPVEEATNDDAITGAHKKVIEPISDSSAPKPDINQLLAAEEAAEAAAVAPPVAEVAAEPTPEAPVEPAPTPEPVAAPEPAPTPADAQASPPPAPVPAPEVQEPPADPNAPNPNDIAL